MTLRRRKKRAVELNAGFDWREIVCASEEAAKAETERQQTLDDADEAEWVYLRNQATGQWIARRTPRHLEVRETSLWQALLEAMLP